MKKIIAFIRHHFLLIFVILVILAVFASVVLRLLTPPNQPVTISPVFITNTNNTKSTFTGLQFTGQVPEFPKELPIYTFKRAAANASTVLTLLQQKFNLVADSQIPNRYVGPAQAVYVNRRTQIFTIEPIQPPTSRENPNFSIRQAKDAGLNFLQEIFPDIQPKAVDSQVAYISEGEGAQQPTSENQTNFSAVKIPYTYYLNNLPVLTSNLTEFPFYITFTPNYEMLNARFFLQSISEFTPVQRSRLLPLETAIQNIQAGQGSIIYVDRSDPQTQTLETIISGVFQSVTLEYRLDEQNNTALPFYRFQGRITNKNGDQMDAEVITPAVSALVNKE
jgi:hypothetical protein